jgi:hypothetical protein
VNDLKNWGFLDSISYECKKRTKGGGRGGGGYDIHKAVFNLGWKQYHYTKVL